MDRKEVNAMKRNHTMRTPEEISQIYFLHKEGLDVRRIGKKLGIKPESVGSALDYISKYWNHKTYKSKKKSTAYHRGLVIIRMQLMKEGRDKKIEFKKHVASEEMVSQPQVQEQVQPQAPTDDRFALLGNSFERFQQSLESFIEAEVDARSTEKALEHEKLKTSNRDLTEKLDLLTDAIDEAKNSNWVDTLRKKWKDEGVLSR